VGEREDEEKEENPSAEGLESNMVMNSSEVINLLRGI